MCIFRKVIVVYQWGVPFDSFVFGGEGEVSGGLPGLCSIAFAV